MNEVTELLFREEKKSFSNAVRGFHRKFEETAINSMCESLAEWAGRKSWTNGYDVEEFQLICREYDYGNLLGIAVEIDLQKIPLSTRQFCYAFVKLADAARQENEKLKSFWFYRLCAWFKRAVGSG